VNVWDAFTVSQEIDGTAMNRACNCVTIHDEISRDWSWFGTRHKNDYYNDCWQF